MLGSALPWHGSECLPRCRQRRRVGGFHNVPSEHSVQSCAYKTVTFSLSRHTSLFSVRSRSDHRIESRDYNPMVAGVAHGSGGECSRPMRSHLQPWIEKTKWWLIHVHVEQMENMENRGKTTQDIGRCRLNVGHIYSVFCGLGFYWLKRTDSQCWKSWKTLASQGTLVYALYVLNDVLCSGCL